MTLSYCFEEKYEEFYLKIFYLEPCYSDPLFCNAIFPQAYMDAINLST